MRGAIYICVGLMLFSSAAVAQEVWFAPPDDLNRGARTYNHDFSHLFDTRPAWSANPNVFVLSPKFTEEAPVEYVQRVASFLGSRHIPVAVGISAVQMDNVARTEGECGFGLEGYTRPNKNHIIFSRLKRFGLNIQYVAIDEALTFGHYYNGKNACRFSIAEVAQRSAATIAEIMAIYPNVKFVDYEAVMPGGQWSGEMQQWLSAYHQATGQFPDSLVFDVDWTKPWLGAVRQGINILHQQGVRAGIFLDGTGPGKSDADAISAFKRNMETVDGAKLPLDLVVIANWTPHPANDLPESDPNSLTGVMHWYKSRHPGQ